MKKICCYILPLVLFCFIVAGSESSDAKKSSASAKTYKIIKKSKIKKTIRKKPAKSVKLPAAPIYIQEPPLVFAPASSEISPLPAKPAIVNSGWKIGGGYGAGAGIINIGYDRFLAPLNLEINAGGGLGNEYYTLITQLIERMPLGSFMLGLSFDYVYYSKKVTSFPGSSGSMPRGKSSGAGLFLEKSFGQWEARLGYSTVLAITATASYNISEKK